MIFLNRFTSAAAALSALVSPEQTEILPEPKRNCYFKVST